MKRVLVTGGAGFLGSHVADALENAGYEVTVFDQQPAAGRRHVLGDLSCLDDLLEATRGFDAVCHLGGVGDVYLAMEKPALAAASNVVGTANLMEACLRNSVRRVVYASTWEVYGKPRYQPVDEEHPCEPDHFYSITKLAGERLALTYDSLKGVPTVALRLGTAYGERMRPNSVFSIFINRAMRKDPLTIHGGGTQSRQFTHARDIAQAFLKALESPVHGDTFNITSPEKVAIRELAEQVVQRLPTALVPGTQRAGDVAPATISAEKARRVLGWEAAIPFKEGLGELIDHHLRQGDPG